MIISFGWTAQYLPPHGPKDTTRRLWAARTLANWQKAWDQGRLTHTAVDKCLAYGGKRIGTITLIERPYRQPFSDMSESDLIREGGMCNTVAEFVDKYFKGDTSLSPVVVRFVFVPSEDGE